MHLTSRGFGRPARLTMVAAGLGAFLIVAGCTTGTGASPAASAAASPAGASAAAGSVALDGTSWQLSSFVAPDGTTVPLPQAVAPTAAFDTSTMSGTAGCNRYNASYTLDGTAIKISTPAMTAMACPDPVMAVESAYSAALAAVDTVAMTADSLTLQAGTGSPKLVFSPVVATTLEGTAWTATGINNGNEAVVSLITGTTVDAVFAADGNVAGSGGCNAYNGGYTVTGSDIKIGPLASTMKACSTPEGVDTQEQQFLAAMQAATTYAINGDTLELRDASGALQVSFTAGAAR